MAYRLPPVGYGGFSQPSSSTETGATRPLPPLTTGGHSHNGSMTSIHEIVPRGFNEIVISDQDRQEGYDPELLNLKPRGAPTGRETVQSPSPSMASMTPSASDDPYRTRGDSFSSLRPSSFGSGNLLYPISSFQDSTSEYPAPYASRPAEPPVPHDSEKQHRRTKSATTRGAPSKVHWWTRKLWWGIISVSLLVLVGVGVGLGVGLGLRHQQTSVGSQKSTSSGGSTSTIVQESLASLSTSSTTPVPVPPIASVTDATASGFATSTRRRSKSSSASQAESTD